MDFKMLPSVKLWHLYVMGRQEFIHVTNTGRFHWVTISNIGCQSSEVDVFDSMHPVITNTNANCCFIMYQGKVYYSEVCFRNYLQK